MDVIKGTRQPQQHLRRSYGRIAVAVVGASAVLVTPRVEAAIKSFTGTGGPVWSASNSWSASGAPTSADSAQFTDTASFTIAGEVTSVLDVDRTITGLIFSNTNGKHHTLDLATRTLTVTGGVNFNNSISGSTTTTIRNGNFVVNTPFSNFNVARGESAGANATANLAGVTSLNATVQEMHVGTTSNAYVNGTLLLSPSNTITAQRVYVGGATTPSHADGLLRLGLNNTVIASEFHVGRDYGNGSVTIVPGGTFSLGSAAQRSSLVVGSGTVHENAAFTGNMNLTGATFNSFLSQLVVGQKDFNGDWGHVVGSLTGATGGSMEIGVPGTNVSNIYVGRHLNGNGGGSSATGTLDLSGLQTLNANLDAFSIGTLVNGTGYAQGTVSLARTNSINANSITVGAGAYDPCLLRLGQSNTILTQQLSIALNQSDATVNIPIGGSLTLGSNTQRAGVTIASGLFTDNRAFTGRLDLSGTTFNAFLSNLVVAHKEGNGEFGHSVGSFIGGNSGNVDIGAVGNTANIAIARNVNGGGNTSATGTVNFGGQTTLNANLNSFSIGTVASGIGRATGIVTLAQTNTISANDITVGLNGYSTSVLNLGNTNTILTNQWTISRDRANATVTIPAGGSLALGSTSQRTTLFIGNGSFSDNTSFTGRLDLTGATFNAHLATVIVGQKDGSGEFGHSVGSLLAGNAGSVTIGGSGNSANLLVAQMLNGGGNTSVTGTVDFGGLASLNANLNSLAVGTVVAGTGAVVGTLALARSNTIDATSIVVGNGGSRTNTLVLGTTNTILTNQWIIGQNNSSAIVTIPTGGSLTLGSPSRLASISIGTGSSADNNLWTGTLDLTGATLIANLDTVVVGSKASATSFRTAVFTISDRPGNVVTANTIQIAAGTNAVTGTLNFGGGQLTAGAISKGVGTATFNWTGGTVSVGTFGTVTTPFNLANSGTGTLAPGSVASSIGTTQVYGNYTQSATGTLAIQIAGSSPTNGNDLLAVSGSSSFGGTLAVALTNGFAPTLGQNFLIATHASRTGTFSFVQPPGMPAGVAFTLDYTTDPTQLMLRTATPVAQNWVAGSGTFGTASNWAAAAVPGTTGDLSIVNNTASAKVVTVGASTTVHRILVQGNTALANLEVPAGVQLGVANQINLVGNALLSGGGKIFGSVVVGGGGGGVPGVGSVAMNGGLTIDPGASVKLTGTDYAGDFTGRSSAATLANAGLLDVGATGLVVATAVEADIRTQIKAGRNAGTWTGAAGITSTAAIADPANRAVGYNVNGAAITVAQTVPGDSNLDGLVNVLDRGTYLANVGQASRNWQQADWNYDDIVNVLDRGIYLGHVGQSLPTPPSFGGGAGGSSTPMLDGPVGGPVAGNTTPGDGVPAVTYDPTTGKLMLDTDGLSNINAIFLPVSPQSRFVTVVGDIDGAAGANWSQFYAGGQNWESALFTPAGNLTMGTWELATMQTGLSASVFSGGIQFILQNGNLVNTTVEVVPEPTGLALAAMTGLGLLARRRRC